MRLGGGVSTTFIISSKVLYGSSKVESDVWRVNVENKEESPFASNINAELWADISPDGKTAAFQSIKNLSQGNKMFKGVILTKPTDSDAPPFHLVAEGFLPVWSPVGGQLAFMRVSGETFNLWTIKAAGGEEEQLTNGDGMPLVEYSLLPYNRTQTSSFNWSPDGKKIAYISDRSGQPNIWQVDADGANNAQLTNNSDSNLQVYCPLWSSDGKRVAYTAKTNKADADGKKFYATYVIDKETKNAKAVVQTETFQRLLGWSPSDKELLLAAINKKSPTYQVGDSPFGIKTAARKSTGRRGGVAASPGTIERTERTALLGKLEVPNTDDLSSPEVADLQKQLLEQI